MHTKSWQAEHVDQVGTLGGAELKRRRVAAFGYDDRGEFAELCGVRVRTVENWESTRGVVPDEKVKLVERVLHEARHRSAPLQGYPDAALVGELARRLSERTVPKRDTTEPELSSTEDHSSPTLPDNVVKLEPGRFTGRSAGPPQSPDNDAE